MTTYTVGGLLAALKPAGMVQMWLDQAYAKRDPRQRDLVWYRKPFRMHKTDLIDELKKLDPASPTGPYYVTVHTYRHGQNDMYESKARNVFIGIVPGSRPNVIQHGDIEE